MKKNIIRTVALLLASATLIACSKVNTQVTEKEPMEETNETLFYDAYKAIGSEEILEAVSMAEITYNPSDPEVMASLSSDIVLVTVTSIDGGSNVNEITGEYVYPYTYGKLQILDTYKGDLSVGQEIEYVRMGGIVTYDSYVASLYPAQREKFISQSGVKPAYIKMMFEQDIELEAGKTYLAYLRNPESGDFSRENAYAMIGWEGGLREVRGLEQADESNSVPQIEVFNNYTNEWESLNTIITK